MQFVLRGYTVDLERTTVERALRGVEPEPLRKHRVEVDGKVYPVKQALRTALATLPEVGERLAGIDFTSADARSILRRLGFKLFQEVPIRVGLRDDLHATLKSVGRQFRKRGRKNATKRRQEARR